MTAKEETAEELLKRLSKEAEQAEKDKDELLKKYANVIDPERPLKYHRKHTGLMNELRLCEWEAKRLRNELQAMEKKVAGFKKDLKQLEEDFEQGKPIWEV